MRQILVKVLFCLTFIANNRLLSVRLSQGNLSPLMFILRGGVQSCFLLFFSFLIANACFGQDIVISKNTKIPYNLTPEVSLFEDASAKLSFEEVRKQSFKKSEKNWVLLPFSNQATWLKIDLKNESYQDTTFYLFLENQLVRRTTLYIKNQADSLVFEPFKDKGFSNLKYPHFPIKLKPNERQSYYLKFESKRGAYFKLQLYNAKIFKGLNDSHKVII